MAYPWALQLGGTCKVSADETAASDHSLKGGKTMSYENRMYLRMAMPWALSGALTILATWAMSAWTDLPLVMGGSTSPFADAPLIVAGVGAIITAIIGARQAYRLWRWQEDKDPECFVCGCLLGAEYRARWNFGRRCLGCRKFVQTR